jgi:hypothetical protein
MCQSVTFVIFIFTIMTAVTVSRSSPTNATPTAHGSKQINPITSGKVGGCFVTPKAACSCVTVGGTAQWLRVLAGRWQSKALAAGALSHTGNI